MKIEILDSTKKKRFLEGVSYLGDFKMRELFFRTGKETVRIYSGSLSNDEILKIWQTFPIEGIGLYFGKEFIDKHGKKESRLSLDALHLLKDNIKKNILVLNSEQEKLWFLGKDLELNEEQKNLFKGEFVAVSNGKDFIGTGKISQDGILKSFLPKERRIRVFQ